MTGMTNKEGLFIEEILLNSVKKLLAGWRARPAKAERLLSGTAVFIWESGLIPRGLPRPK
jgi:hypothetical protein